MGGVCGVLRVRKRMVCYVCIGNRFGTNQQMLILASCFPLSEKVMGGPFHTKGLRATHYQAVDSA
jgi:hypothetical protein